MHQFVQSAIDAANQGDKNKAMNFLKEVISANPKDADAWLVLAAIMDEPERKRQCLNRVLSLDPTNKLAREELLEMDRSSMGGSLPFTAEPSPAFAPDRSSDQAYDGLDPVSKPKSQPRSQMPMSLESSKPASQPIPTQTKHVSLNDWAEESPKAKPRSATKARTERAQVFRYSTVTRIATYLFAALFGCSFLLALQDVTLLLIPCGASLLILPAVWIVSKQVELSEKGIRVSSLFGLFVSDIGWNEIARIQSKQNNLALITKKGRTVKVTTQVVGYPTIVETLRQKRPDLFAMAPASTQGNGSGSTNGISPSMSRDIPATAPNFSGIRTFKKNFFKQYGLLLIVIPFCFFAAWTAYAEPEYRIGAGLSAVFCLVMMVLPFFQIGLVKVEPNKLTVESFIEQKAFSAHDIREIKMASVRGRRGRITNYVNILTAQGKNYPVQGFSDGDEIIYGILHQWWEAYRNR
jgi:hypothetical protein